MCATKNLSLPIPAKPSARWNRSAFVMGLLLVVEAFRDALAMRRTAQTRVFLGDE
jgi:hypothetical protein